MSNIEDDKAFKRIQKIKKSVASLKFTRRILDQQINEREQKIDDLIKQYYREKVLEVRRKVDEYESEEMKDFETPLS
jgi:hypothetical protein